MLPCTVPTRLSFFWKVERRREEAELSDAEGSNVPPLPPLRSLSNLIVCRARRREREEGTGRRVVVMEVEKREVGKGSDKVLFCVISPENREI